MAAKKVVKKAVKATTSRTTQPTGQMDPRLAKGGVAVVSMSGLASTAVEAQVVRWREETGLLVDWCYIAGRAIVYCLPQHKAKLQQHLRFFGVTVHAHD